MLNQLFKDAIKIIAEHPHEGKVTYDSLARIKIVKGYLIIYEETASQIQSDTTVLLKDKRLTQSDITL